MTGKTLREQLLPLLKGERLGQYLRCGRKRRYFTERAAERKRVERLTSDVNPPAELYVVRCDLCRAWHLSRLRPPTTPEKEPSRGT